MKIASMHKLLGMIVSMSVMTITQPSIADEPSPPILFLHGNGDSAALWYTTLWHFESNGYNKDRLFAMDFINPTSPSQDNKDEPNRSTTQEQVEQLIPKINTVLQNSKASKLVLVGSSRGGNTLRNYLKNYAKDQVVETAILCGTPNHGVWLSETQNTASEWNGEGPFLKQLNHPTETYQGVRFATINSDKLDKYAQPKSLFYDLKGPGYTGSHLKGAENIVIPNLDHREVAFHPKAFSEIYRIITGKKPNTLEITPEPEPILSGIISGFENSRNDNIAIPNASITIYSIDPKTAIRKNQTPVYQQQTTTGHWGPFRAQSTEYYEIVVRAENYPITHYFKAPYLRSSDYIHWRLQPLRASWIDTAKAVIKVTRPRGYFGMDRDHIVFDQQKPQEIAAGIPTQSEFIRLLDDVNQTHSFEFNQERVPIRSYPLAENRISVAELHF